MQIDGGGHVLITDLCVAPLRWEEAKEKATSGTCPCNTIPLALGMHGRLLPSSGSTQQRKAVLLCCPKLLSCAVPRASLISLLMVLNKYPVSEGVLASS